MKKVISKVAVATGVCQLLLSFNLTTASAATEYNAIENSYAKDAIIELVESGVVTGNNGDFNPVGQISRQDLAIVLAKALNLNPSTTPATPTFSEIPSGQFPYSSVDAAVKAGLINEVNGGVFKSKVSVTQ